MEKTNVLGRKIFIGHPTGTRIVLTLVGDMARKEHALGLATLCIGGGQGMATVSEKVLGDILWRSEVIGRTTMS